jgi:hypothetical protein
MVYNNFMKKKKKIALILKKKLHPFLSYATLIGVGAIAVSSTGSLVGVNTENTVIMPIVAAETAPLKSTTPENLVALKTSATEFASQLSIIKSQIGELEKYGHNPPPALIDAIDQGDQLVATIEQAQTLKDIGDFDAASRLQSIGAAIAANSKF